MEKGYFAAAWGDVTKSPGWISKILRLGLLGLVPIFGQIVIYGYLYAWARDIAWNVHRPMPDKIFGNEDGNLYKRGFFVFVIALVASLVPGAFNFLSSFVSGTTVAGGAFGVLMGGASYSYAPVVGGLFLSMVSSFISLVLAFAVCFFFWVGSMRTTLYGTLSAGFQINKIWAMLRYDFTGLLRIFAMVLVIGLVIGFAFFSAMLTFVLIAAIAMSAASLGGSGSFFIALVGAGIFFLFGVALLLLAVFCAALCEALFIRALGYWTRQFEVNRWGGQEDPMPFEQRSVGQQPSVQVGAEGDPQWRQAAAQAPSQHDVSPYASRQAQSGFQGAQPFQPASYHPSGSVPVQVAPYQVGQQPVIQAPFEENQHAVVQKADFPASESGGTPEASDRGSSSVDDSAGASANTPTSPSSPIDEHQGSDAPEDSGTR